MSHTPNFDTKLKFILDSLQSGERTCVLTGEKWNMTDEEISWYKKFNVPPSKLSPMTRLKIKTGFYAGYQWWWNQHAETGKPVLTCDHPATGLKVLPDVDWFDRDFLEQGREIDFLRPFFEQFRGLQESVPFLATRNLKEPTNSIALVSNGDIDSYFVLACVSKNAFYSTNAGGERFMEVNGSYDVFDSFRIDSSNKVYNSKYVLASREITNSMFVFDCQDVSDSFFAWNKKHKKYLWFNEQLTKEEFEQRISKIDLSFRSELKKYEEQFIQALSKQAVWPENFNVNAINSNGEYLRDVKNCHNCFTCWNQAQDLYYVIHGYDRAERIAFVAGTYGSSDVYDSCTVTNSSDIKFCFYVVQSRGLEYCAGCFNCENCFGCVGLKHKKFHVFNKEYSEEEYWKKVDELKCAMLDRGEYGEFFPLNFSQSYLPQSGNALYFLVSDEEQKTLGGKMFDPESQGAIGDLALEQNPILSSSLPDKINENSDALVGKVIFDEKLKRRFSILKPELDFYRNYNLPLPDEHFISRLLKVISWTNSGVGESGKCASCGKEIVVAKNKAFEERVVYCKECYLRFLEENN